MRPSSRLEAIPPYKFQELEQQIADKRAAGIDVISLGIGDPDEPTYPHIVEAMQRAVANPAYHQYPSNRGHDDFRQGLAEPVECMLFVAVEHDLDHHGVRKAELRLIQDGDIAFDIAVHLELPHAGPTRGA